MFRRILFAAALAGLIGGVFATAAQSLRVIPIILEAETYETAAVLDHDPSHATTADSDADEWAPGDGVERTAFTLVTNVLAGIGFALLLAAGFALAGGADWRRGLYWGAAGFVAFTLAPAIGLPPEIPGAEAAPLADRQLWWLGTVVATGGGLALIFLSRKAAPVALGVGLIVLPHVIGAPQPAAHGGLAPDSLARDFVVAALVASFLFWLVLGAFAGFFYKRFAAV